MSNDLKCHSKEEQATSLAQYLHNGKIFQLKNVAGSLLRKLLLGWSSELQRVEQKIKETSVNHDIFDTTLLIEEWESALGIPDDCFSGRGTIEKRRTDVLIKLGVVLLTEQDYIDLGTLLGIKVKIKHFVDTVFFPLPFPLPFSPSGKVAKFTMIIQMSKEVGECIFPLDFPICFNATEKNEIECIFEKLSPANVRLIFEFVL